MPGKAIIIQLLLRGLLRARRWLWFFEAAKPTYRLVSSTAILEKLVSIEGQAFVQIVSDIASFP